MTTRCWPLPLCALTLLSGWIGIRLLGDVRHTPLISLAVYALLFLAYLAALRYIAKHPVLNLRSNLKWILGTAVLLRLVMIGADPVLSDDIYRYRWDARVQQAGINPYRFAPDSAELSQLRDSQFEWINFPHLNTVYPPVMQMAFRWGHVLQDGLSGQKGIFLFFEAILAATLIVLLRQKVQSELWVAAYLWHPLPIMEIAYSGHNDIVAVSLLWIGVGAWLFRRPGLAALSWALSFGAKFLALLWVPWWLARRRYWGYLAGGILFGAALIVFYPHYLPALTGSMTAISGRVESNASIFYLLIQWISPALARGAVVCAGMLFSLWWARKKSDPIIYLQGVLFAALLLSPAVHPWYWVWLIPGLCFWRQPVMMALSGSTVLAYAVWPGYLATGVWSLPLWARVTEYGIAIAVWLWIINKSRSASSFRQGMKPVRSEKS